MAKALHHVWNTRRMSVDLSIPTVGALSDLPNVADCIAIGTRNVSGSGSWRTIVGIGILWALILGIGILFMPESPR